MYSRPYDRAECIINGYYYLVDKLLNYLVFVVGRDLHLTRNKENQLLCTRVSNLHNLSSDPKKALKILSSIKSILESCKTQGKTNEDKEFYLEMIKHQVKYEFFGDLDAIIFIDLILDELSVLVDDDSQFSDFDYF